MRSSVIITRDNGVDYKLSLITKQRETDFQPGSYLILVENLNTGDVKEHFFKCASNAINAFLRLKTSSCVIKVRNA